MQIVSDATRDRRRIAKMSHQIFDILIPLFCFNFTLDIQLLPVMNENIYEYFQIKQNCPHVSPIILCARVIKQDFDFLHKATDVWSAAELSTAVSTYAGRTGSGAYHKKKSHCQQKST